MKILVTGASGYIGNKLVRVLATKGHQVNAFVRSSSSKKLLQHFNISIFEGDILDEDSLAKAMNGCEQVYHTAGMVKFWSKDPTLFYQQNVGGTNNVLKTALQSGVKKLVYTSTCGVWSPCDDHLYTENDPSVSSFNNDYDLSKYLAEKAVREYSCKGLFTVVVNPPRVYGPGQHRYSSAINRFICQLLNNKISPLLWRLETKANYAFVDDVVNGHILAMENGLGGERYILGGENISYKKFIETVISLSRTKNIFIRIPTPFLKAWSWIELMRSKMNGHDPLMTPNIVKRVVIDKIFDCSKAIRQLGYEITPFTEGIRITIDHLKNENHVRH
ncbi:MAG TPA: NAD-dependent epimerase/dehydratase family protein [Chitinophagaceae bacterium]|nr:NAD-dependent epimerase/dehydratase family protein [Chitinophagaceae bacterium]